MTAGGALGTEAQGHIAITATKMYRDMGMTYRVEQAEAEMRELA